MSGINSSLMIPGCLCCPKAGGPCDPGDLDFTGITGYTLNIPDCTIDDQSGEFDPFYWPRNKWSFKDDRVDSPRLSPGGKEGCCYDIELTLSCRIDRGSYWNGSQYWPGYYIDYPRYLMGMRSVKIKGSTGERMMHSYVEQTGIVRTIHSVPGPVWFQLSARNLRFTIDCYIKITNITCVAAYSCGAESGFGLSPFGLSDFGF